MTNKQKSLDLTISQMEMFADRHKGKPGERAIRDQIAKLEDEFEKAGRV